MGPVGDRYELEAERIADAVVRREGNEEPPLAELVTPLVQRQAADEIPEGEDDAEDEEQELRARRAGSRALPALAPSFEHRLLRTRSGGEPLRTDVRSAMEVAFGASFDTVRTHSDGEAAELARGIDAVAFTHGTHIFFGHGRLVPDEPDGKRLLAHELTHVVQQNPRIGGDPRRPIAGSLQRQPAAGSAAPTATGKPQHVAVIALFDANDKLIGDPYTVTIPELLALDDGVYDVEVTMENIIVATDPPLLVDYVLKPERVADLTRALPIAKRKRLIVGQPGRPKAEGDAGPPPSPGKLGKTTKPGSPGAGSEAGTEEAEGSAGTSGSKYGWLGLIHPPKWLTSALDKAIEKLGYDEEIKEIRALLTALKDLYDHRDELGSLFTLDNLLDVLLGVDTLPGLDALEKWAQRPSHKIRSTSKSAIASVATKLLKLLEVVRSVLRPIFRVRSAFAAAFAGFARILDKVPLLEDVFSTSGQERQEVLEGVADSISEQAKLALEGVRAHIDFVVATLEETNYVTAEEVARAIASVVQKFLPKAGKAVTWVADKLGVDLVQKVADHIIAPLIPDGAIEKINGVVHKILGGLDPLIKAVVKAIDDVIAGIESAVHDVLEPELKTLLAQLSPRGGRRRAVVSADHVAPVMAASDGQSLPEDVRASAQSRLGVDLGDVRVHADAHAALAADTLDAKAFTVGRDIFFGPGQYAPRAREGQRLLVHELVHVVQQADGTSTGTVRRNVKGATTKVASSLSGLALRGLKKLTDDATKKRGAVITKLVEKLVSEHARAASTTLPADAYYYLTNKRKTRIDIRRKPPFTLVVPKLTISKGGLIEKSARFVSPLKLWQDRQRAKLRRALGCGTGEQAHHVIPLELWGPFGTGGHGVVTAAVRAGFQFNEVENGICLPEGTHGSSHPKYTTRVERQLDAYRGLPVADQLAGVRKVAKYQQMQLNNRTEVLD